MRLVNGVDISATPVFPRDGLCPECGQPFSGVQTSQIVAIQTFKGLVEAVEAGEITDLSFTPCGHDARGCFPSPDISLRSS